MASNLLRKKNLLLLKGIFWSGEESPRKESSEMGRNLLGRNILKWGGIS